MTKQQMVDFINLTKPEQQAKAEKLQSDIKAHEEEIKRISKDLSFMQEIMSIESE